MEPPLATVPTETPPTPRSRSGSMPIVIIAASLTILVLLLVFFALPGTTFAPQIRKPGEIEQLRESVKILLESYMHLTSLITGAFGLFAFLITLQQKKNARLSGLANALMLTGTIFLAGSLVFCLLGREMLLLMVSRNAIDLGASALQFSRWTAYACLVAAASSASLFAMEVTLSVSDSAPQTDGG